MRTINIEPTISDLVIEEAIPLKNYASITNEYKIVHQSEQRHKILSVDLQAIRLFQIINASMADQRNNQYFAVLLGYPPDMTRDLIHSHTAIHALLGYKYISISLGQFLVRGTYCHIFTQRSSIAALDETWTHI
ncbi:hypothetical protein RF11_06861 [Thelohanellus kitauei]|uniref:Uncharacterized protein n=1 Tax=Thelohanellus kitauei TaxID=669202 RepID=A0A0C2NA09_THEKT|nr:hypothetical protein RF11_06861 [Thelohanellus kitauei]